MEYNKDLEKSVLEVSHSINILKDNIEELDKIFKQCNENLKGRVSLSDSED